MIPFRRGDWVLPEHETPGVDGIVRRVARDGTWVDVRWKQTNGAEWSKRMKPGALRKVQTINRGGYSITSCDERTGSQAWTMNVSLPQATP